MITRKPALALGVFVLVLVLAEGGYQLLRPPEAYVKVINEGDEPIEDLRLTFGSQEVPLPTIAAGASARALVSGYRKKPLKVRFRQRGNAMTGFETVNFDPAALERDRFVFVIAIRPNEYERSQDDGDPPAWSRVGSRIWDWLERSLNAQ